METTQNIKQFADNREERAKLILQNGDPVKFDDNTYYVPSQFDSTKKYQVTHFDSYSCNCKDFELRCKGKGLYCKHIKAILLFEKIKARYEVEPEVEKEIKFIINTPQQELCPFCASENLIKSGLRKTQFGNKQRYECKSCKKRFVLSPIPKIKGNEKLVCLAMDCFYKGLSYRDIADQFKQFYGLSLSHETIRNWVLRFSRIMEKYAKTLTPKTSGIWNADETLILTKRGQDKKKSNINFDYVWNVMDNKTKFLLASVNSGRSRSKIDAENAIREAFLQNKKTPNKIITDRNTSYADGISRVFKPYKYHNSPKHISILGKRRIVNNNAIESHHTQQKEFQKVRKGVTEVQTYQDGFKVFHNFVRKNIKDKTTPAEKCGIGVEGNKWNTLLLNSIKNNV